MPKKNDNFQSDRILSYFRREWTVLLLVTISGLIYNLGLLAGPWFEGRLVGCLVNILNGSAVFSDMLVLVIGYVVAITVVQSSRYVKRFYVRRFANNVNRNMKCILYRNLVQKSRVKLQEEGAGNLLTKAILDVDDCVEGMRKFTTEIFDTGVALATYACMLLYYDRKLALLCMLFPPISYVLAEKMKVFVQRTGAAYKVQSGILSSATMDRASNALTYRVFGRESDRRQAYEQTLMDYEHSAVRANVWTSIMPPIYRIISMTGVLFLIYFGIRNVQGNGWANWNVAIFTTFLTCFTKLSTKSSRAAKLFNAVHKAQVSWKRIRPLMHPAEESAPADVQPAKTLSVQDLAFTYPNGTLIFSGLSFDAVPGQIIGVTGPVACGKSTLGKAFLCEFPYDGSIRIGGKELSSFSDVTRTGTIGYLGHDPELFQDTVENNILMGDALDANTYLKLVCLKEEADAMEQGIQTFIGTGGVRLSGGQAKRLALARTFAHMRPVLILDDPFSALDRTTEEQIFANLKMLTRNSIVLLISHRLYQFPEMDQVIWMNEGHTVVGTHEQLLQSVPGYAALYNSQKGDSHEEH